MRGAPRPGRAQPSRNLHQPDINLRLRHPARPWQRDRGPFSPARRTLRTATKAAQRGAVGSCRWTPYIPVIIMASEQRRTDHPALEPGRARLWNPSPRTGCHTTTTTWPTRPHPPPHLGAQHLCSECEPLSPSSTSPDPLQCQPSIGDQHCEWHPATRGEVKLKQIDPFSP